MDSTVLNELVASPVGVAGFVAFGLIAIGIAARGTPTLDRTFADRDRKANDTSVTDVESAPTS